MLTGLDVSEHQGDVDWKKVATKHELAFLRVAEGDYKDPTYTKARVEAVRAAGLLFGPYYFARVASQGNEERDGAEEAAMAVRFAKAGGWRWPGDLPLMYDVETDNFQPEEKCARHFVQFVRAYRDSEGHYPGIYTMPGFWQRILPHLGPEEKKVVAECPLWQAEWEVERPRPLAPWKGATLWQWTEHGHSPGIKGEVDLDRSLVPDAQIRALATSVPSWVPPRHVDKWMRPWEPAAARSTAFRDLLWRHDYLSPNFTRKEAACNDPKHTPLPASLRANGQRQAFQLERLRHELGDAKLPVIGWYRTRAWNAHVGGPPKGRHLQGDATDFSRETAESFGIKRFDTACDKVYAKGGFGRHGNGSRHCDARGKRVRW